MATRVNIKVILTALLLTSQVGCFKAATTTAGKSLRVKTSTTTLTAAATSDTKSTAEVNFNATETQTISVGKESSLSGTSVAFAPGSLSISTSIIVEEGASFADADMSTEMGLSGDQSIASAGAGVIVRPSTDAVLTKPLTLSLPLPSVSGLRLASTHYAVTYKYLDPESSQLVTGIKPVDGIDVKIVYDEASQKDAVQFTGYFGIYWVVTLAREMAKSEIPAPKVSTQPIVNKANVSVIATNGIVKESEVLATQAKPELVWTKPTLAFTSSTRKVALSSSMSAAEVKNCRAEFHKSATDLSGLVLDLGSLRNAEIPAPSEKTSLVGRYRCLDLNDRLSVSPWSDPVAIPAVEVVTTPVVTTPPVVVPPPDTTAPVVLGVSSTMANGTYSATQVISLTVSFSEPVNVTGSALLAMAVGSPSTSASYVSGSGSSVLSFNFTIAGTHSATDLDYISTSSLTGDIKDLAGNAANLTLPPLGSSGSLSGAKQIVIDNTPASVTSVSSPTGPGIFIAGQPVEIAVSFSREVFVSGGTPHLTLNTSPARTALYVSGSGTNTLNFAYSVVSGDTSMNLDTQSTSSFVTNGATVLDSVGNSASLVLPTPGGASSLSGSLVIEIAGNADYPVLSTAMPTQLAVAGTAIMPIDVNNQSGADTTYDSRPITYTCLFDYTPNGTMDGGGSACAMLEGTYSFNPSTGTLNWTPSPSISIPNASVPKDVEFKFIGTNTANLTHFSYATVQLIKPFTTMVGFDAGDSASYIFDPAKVEFINGTARLRMLDQKTDSQSEFSPTTRRGLAYDMGTQTLKTDAYASCNGRTENCALNDDMTLPLFGNLMNRARFDIDVTPFDLPAGGTQQPSLILNDKKLGVAALSFDGGDHLSVSHMSPQTFSINFWMKSNYQGVINSCADWRDGQRLVSVDEGTAMDTLFGISLCGGKISSGVSAISPVTLKSLDVVADGAWHMITFTRDYSSGEIRLYVDGFYQGFESANTAVLNGSTLLKLGFDPAATNNYVGAIDEFALWNAILNQGDIESLYAKQSTRGSGFVDSFVMDGGNPSAIWTNLSLATTQPFGKEIVDMGSTETLTDYPQDNSSFSTNLRALWHLNETTGDYLDTSGSGVMGITSGTMRRLSPGRFLRAPTFDGASSVNFGQTTQLEFGGDSFTVSAWFRTTTKVGTRTILSNGYSSNNEGFVLEMIDQNLAFGICQAGGSSALCSKGISVESFSDGAWHHVVAYADRGSNRLALYIDGRQVNMAIHSSGQCGTVNLGKIDISGCPSLSANRGNTDIGLGATINPSPSNMWVGQIDEVAVWGRTPSSDEILNLYRRGANRVLVQIRTCSDSTCAGAQFKGPDGTNRSYFSEIHNNLSPNASTGAVKPGTLNLNFADFPSLGLTNLQYFQYRLILENDDRNTICNGLTQNCSPEVRWVHVGPNRYPTTGAAVSYNIPTMYFNIQNLIATYGPETCPGGARYSLSTDNSTWQYYTGSSWLASAGDMMSTMDESTLNSSLVNFDTNYGVGPLYVRTLLMSDGNTPCSIDNYTIMGNSML